MSFICFVAAHKILKRMIVSNSRIATWRNLSNGTAPPGMFSLPWASLQFGTVYVFVTMACHLSHCAGLPPRPLWHVIVLNIPFIGRGA